MILTFLLLFSIPMIFVVISKKLSTLKKVLIIIGYYILIFALLTYLFIDGFERGMNERMRNRMEQRQFDIKQIDN
ncbi:hypothetical protein KRX57_09130 [Weeksellaceae bacterium TAE3-ERU29]|nr:hypothetical protein [Weeksellaceae bacterium TAE3-ERU29]